MRGSSSGADLALAPVGPALLARSGAPGPMGLAVHLVASAGLGLAWMVTLVAGLGSGLALFPVGVPVAGATLLLARLGADLERDRLGRVFGRRLDACERPLPGRGFWARVRAAGGDPQVWRDAAYFLLLGPVALASLVAVAAWLAVALGGTVALLWLPGLDRSVAGIAVGTVPAAVVLTLAGVGALASLRWLPGALGSPGRWLAHSLLGPDVDRLQRRADRLEARSALVERVAAAERRRLERDLHDGAQARLVSAGLTLGMLLDGLRAGGAPEPLTALAADAHQQVRASIAELRALAQGIHPLGLVEGGLVEALEQLAGRSPIPVRLSVRLDGRPDPEIERAAYFVVAESLTNAVRHSGATALSVQVHREGPQLRLRVADDGAGGAVASPAGGLGGLVERVESVGGRLVLHSPAGAGTQLDAELPWDGLA